MSTTVTENVLGGDWGGALVEKNEHFVYKDTDRKTKTRCVDAWRVACILVKHLPGQWKVITERKVDLGDKYQGHCDVERAGGLKLHIQSSTGYGKEYAIRVSLGWYGDALGHHIDTRYLVEGARGSAAPDARCNVEKRGPKAIAADITRRVIKPCEPYYAAILKRQQESKETQDARAAFVAKVAGIPGVKVREHWNNKKASIIETGPDLFRG